MLKAAYLENALSDALGFLHGIILGYATIKVTVSKESMLADWPY